MGMGLGVLGFCMLHAASFFLLDLFALCRVEPGCRGDPTEGLHLPHPQAAAHQGDQGWAFGAW